MPSYYPVYLDLRGRRCAVIGGGEEAQRMVPGMLECGATVTVISPRLTTGLRDRAGRGLIDWVERDYEPGDLKGVFLAIASETGDMYTNRAAAWEAKESGTLLNVMDVPPLCAWIAPAIVRRGEVAFAISTAGLSPALNRRLREEMERSPILRWADMAGLLSEVRLSLRRRRVRVPPEKWQEAMDDRLLELFHQGHHDQAKQLLTERLLQASSVAATEGGR